MKKRRLPNETYNLKELLELCSKLLEEQKYEQVVHILENISSYLVVETTNIEEEEGHILLVFLLALAYHAIAATKKNPLYYEKMLILLKRFQPILEDDPSWSSFMGKAYMGLEDYKKAIFYFENSCANDPIETDVEIYLANAYCFINREDKALNHFETLSKKYPENKFFKDRIQYCYDCIYIPYFKENFNQRVTLTWEEFSKQEQQLYELASDYFQQAPAPEYMISPPEKIFHKIYDILELAVDELIIFWRKRNGKIQIILSTNYTRYKVFTLEKLVNQMPEHLKNHWEFLVGIPPEGNQNIVLGDFAIGDFFIDTDNVFLWIDNTDEELTFSFYCERLKHLSRTSTIVLMVCDLIANQIGEFALMNFILKNNLKLDILDVPKEEEPILLSNFYNEVEKQGLTISNDLKEYLGYQVPYENEPDLNWKKEWLIRNDVFSGKSKIPMILDLFKYGYQYHTPKIYEYFYSCGAVIGFFCFPVECFRSDDKLEIEEYYIENLSQEWLCYLKNKLGDDAITLIGTATGLCMGYFDFIAWDFETVSTATKEFFEKTSIEWVNFHSFYPRSKAVKILSRE